jgi:large-conductance mechanosensitive channel
MIRLFIFILVRFFIIALAIYLALTLLRKIIHALQEHSHPSQRNPRQENQPKPKEEYKDVKDAKFVELPKNQTKENQNSHS